MLGSDVCSIVLCKSYYRSLSFVALGLRDVFYVEGDGAYGCSAFDVNTDSV